MKIANATTSDAEEIHRIHLSAVRTICKDFYTAKIIETWLKGRTSEGYHKGIDKGEIYVAKNNGKIVGFGHAIPGEVVAVFVDPIFHRKGVGKLILDYGLRIALKNHQKVKVQSTVNAEKFYKKHGFVKMKDDVTIRNGIEIPIVIMEYLAK